jgi:hypothetical protein
VAPLEAFQVKVVVCGTPVAPFAGETKTGAGGAASVVNNHVAELVEPALFLATIRQW